MLIRVYIDYTGLLAKSVKQRGLKDMTRKPRYTDTHTDDSSRITKKRTPQLYFYTFLTAIKIKRKDKLVKIFAKFGAVT